MAAARVVSEQTNKIVRMLRPYVRLFCDGAVVQCCCGTYRYLGGLADWRLYWQMAIAMAMAQCLCASFRCVFFDFQRWVMWQNLCARMGRELCSACAMGIIKRYLKVRNP